MPIDLHFFLESMLVFLWFFVQIDQIFLKCRLFVFFLMSFYFAFLEAIFEPLTFVWDSIEIVNGVMEFIHTMLQSLFSLSEAQVKVLWTFQVNIFLTNRIKPFELERLSIGSEQ